MQIAWLVFIVLPEVSRLNLEQFRQERISILRSLKSDYQDNGLKNLPISFRFTNLHNFTNNCELIKILVRALGSKNISVISF